MNLWEWARFENFNIKILQSAHNDPKLNKTSDMKSILQMQFLGTRVFTRSRYFTFCNFPLLQC